MPFFPTIHTTRATLMTFSKKPKKKKKRKPVRKNQSANEPLALQWRQQRLPHSHKRTHINKATTFLAMQTCVMAVRVSLPVCVCMLVYLCV